MDPLSDLLANLGARSIRRTRLEAAGEWALAFPSLARLKFVALVRGNCWLLLPDQPPLSLVPGDIYVIGRTSYVVASDPVIAPVDGMRLCEPGHDVVRLGGDETILVGGGIALVSDWMGFIFDALPSFMRISKSSPSAEATAKTLDLLQAELGQSRLGGSLVTARLADVLLVEAIRAYIADHGNEAFGWFGAIADRRIGVALRLMHDEVAHPWTVKALAAQACMSRSAFALQFTRRVGRAPLEYLRYWRMVLARQALSHGESNVATIAARVGYNSQSAFANAFKRTFGHSPKRAEISSNEHAGSHTRESQSLSCVDRDAPTSGDTP